jgi:hypothetical protein
MTTVDAMDVPPGFTAPARAADRLLKGAGVIWFVVAALGQIAFAAHVAVFFGGNAAAGNVEAINKRLINGIIDSDPMGNFVLALHLGFAVVITLSGLLQLTPQVRDRWPVFHHWNGRVYLLAAIVMAFGGLHMVWTRGTLGTFVNYLGISVNALLILMFAFYAVKSAIARNIDTHRRWALRLFLVVSGVWFMRIGYMSWLIVNQAPVGMEDNLDGPFDTFIVFASYLIPLAVLELYFRAQDARTAVPKLAMAATMLAATGITALGAFGTVTIMWRKEFLALLPA